MNKAMIMVAVGLLGACTQGKVENASSRDTTSSVEVRQEVIEGAFPQLDVDHFTVIDTTDIFLENVSGPSDSAKTVSPEAHEQGALQEDARVTRTSEGFQFRLKNGENKLLRENTNTDGDDFVSYTFLEPMDNIGQWLLMGGYYEAFDYVLIDQQDGSENHLWGRPVLSPDGKYFLTGMVDLEAAFRAHGLSAVGL